MVHELINEMCYIDMVVDVTKFSITYNNSFVNQVDDKYLGNQEK